MPDSKYDFCLISYLPSETLNDPVLKPIIETSCGAHVQAHDRAAGAPDERQVIRSRKASASRAAVFPAALGLL